MFFLVSQKTQKNIPENVLKIWQHLHLFSEELVYRAKNICAERKREIYHMFMFFFLFRVVILPTRKASYEDLCFCLWHFFELTHYLEEEEDKEEEVK